MKGFHRVVVRNNRLVFDFTLRRNITVLRGKSATGKTTLIEMVAEYARSGTASGVHLQCDKPCMALGEDMWELRLSSVADSIVFIDEGNSFILSEDFARMAQESSNYYVIAARYPLPQLPYSVEEVYSIANKTRAKKQGISRIYSHFSRMYETRSGGKMRLPEAPDCVIVEDSNAGFEFFSAYFGGRGASCVSAHGKSLVAKEVLRTPDDADVLVVADGAAFGSEMDKLQELSRQRQLSLFLPESFEWLILRSGILRRADISEVLASPADYIESSEFFSWERFFTAYLIEVSGTGPLRYSKKHLGKAYLSEKNMERIAGAAEDV